MNSRTCVNIYECGSNLMLSTCISNSLFTQSKCIILCLSIYLLLLYILNLKNLNNDIKMVKTLGGMNCRNNTDLISI